MTTGKPEDKDRNDNITAIEQPISETLYENFMPYAMSVIVSRAIPEIDGFKPAHRKLLYTMYLMNLMSGPRAKSADVVGQTMKLNPHGDQTIYETMVRLTRGNKSLLHPWIDSKVIVALLVDANVLESLYRTILVFSVKSS
jgi:DNA gyrase subunit A